MNFLPTLKELVRAYQAFEGYSAPHIRSLGLTLVQFDVIATLGNQSPMTFKELGFKTLISKSALTGVVERMAQKGMLTISDNPDDARGDGEEITDVRWFSRAELKAAAADRSLLLPPSISVARKMIERWLGESAQGGETWR